MKQVWTDGMTGAYKTGEPSGTATTTDFIKKMIVNVYSFKLLGAFLKMRYER